MPHALPLRNNGPLVEPLGEFNAAGDSLPRALRSLGAIIDGGLCHRCGTCSGVCPADVLAFDDDDYPVVQDLASCADCGLCVKACPGAEFDYFAAHRKVLGIPARLGATHGHFSCATVAHSTDPFIRTHSTSGGVVTAVLSELLERQEIDGALVIVSDDKQIWKGKPIIARTRAELLESMKSKYAICPTNAALSQVIQRPGRYAAVGLPCQIHGIIKAAALNRKIKERVVLTIGLFCHAALDHEAFRVLWAQIGVNSTRARRFVSRVGKHPGTPKIQLEDGTWYPVFFGSRERGYRPSSIEGMNVMYRLYTPPRCWTCFDALAEFADIAVGDPWLPPPERGISWYDGWSFVLVRTERGRDVYEKLIQSRTINSVALTRGEALLSNKVMAHEKRARAFRVIEWARRVGRPAPLYGPARERFPEPRGLRSLRVDFNLLTHVFCFYPKHRNKLLRFLLSPFGYWLFWANYQRRRFREFRRYTSYKLKTSLLGRR